MRRACPELPWPRAPGWARALRRGALVVAAACALACGAAPQPPVQERSDAFAQPGVASAEAWPEADALFRSDPRWLGGDAAVSVELDQGRVLWLFGDSFIAAQPAPASRAGARMVRNSVALQHGQDPTRARLRFYHRVGPDGAPASFFPEQGDSWFWPGHGLYRGGVLTLFLMRMRAVEGAPAGLGFEVAGTSAVRIENADDEPHAWRFAFVPAPDAGELRVIGASVLLEGEHVYAYAVREPGDHAVMLLRWPLAEFERGELLAPTWYAGPGRGFVAEGPKAVVLAPGATEFSVSRAPSGGYVQVQSRGFGPAPVALRFAPGLAGPFGAFVDAFTPDEAQRRDVLLYAARAHPELTGADLVVTYASNTLDPALLLSDLALYFPRFVRIEFSP